MLSKDFYRLGETMLLVLWRKDGIGDFTELLGVVSVIFRFCWEWYVQRSCFCMLRSEMVRRTCGLALCWVYEWRWSSKFSKVSNLKEMSCVEDSIVDVDFLDTEIWYRDWGCQNIYPLGSLVDWWSPLLFFFSEGYGDVIYRHVWSEARIEFGST